MQLINAGIPHGFLLAIILMLQSVDGTLERSSVLLKLPRLYPKGDLARTRILDDECICCAINKCSESLFIILDDDGLSDLDCFNAANEIYSSSYSFAAAAGKPGLDIVVLIPRLLAPGTASARKCPDLVLGLRDEKSTLEAVISRCFDGAEGCVVEDLAPSVHDMITHLNPSAAQPVRTISPSPNRTHACCRDTFNWL